jgi:hypothetical protein
LALEIENDGPSEEEIRRRIDQAGLAVTSASISLAPPGARRSLNFTLRYPTTADDTQVPPLVGALAREPGVAKVDWRGPL